MNTKEKATELSKLLFDFKETLKAKGYQCVLAAAIEEGEVWDVYTHLAGFPDAITACYESVGVEMERMRLATSTEEPIAYDEAELQRRRSFATYMTTKHCVQYDGAGIDFDTFNFSDKMEELYAAWCGGLSSLTPMKLDTVPVVPRTDGKKVSVSGAKATA